MQITFKELSKSAQFSYYAKDKLARIEITLHALLNDCCRVMEKKLCICHIYVLLSVIPRFHIGEQYKVQH